MATMTLAVPSDLKVRMELFPEINWSEVARQAFKEKIRDLEFLEKFKEQSTITEKDALELGSEINQKLSKRYLES